MNSFDNIHSDSTNFNARDEYEAREELRLSQTHDEDGNYIWDDEALAWEDGFDCDELYDYDDEYVCEECGDFVPHDMECTYCAGETGDEY